jgi:hypothetical protein
LPGRTLYAGSFTSVRRRPRDYDRVLMPTSLVTRSTIATGCPTFLAQHPERDVLRAASEAPDGEI